MGRINMRIKIETFSQKKNSMGLLTGRNGEVWADQ